MTNATALRITEERTFSVEMGGRAIGGMTKGETWKGLTEYRRADGTHLIVLDADQRVITGSASLLSHLGLTSDEDFILIPETKLQRADGSTVLVPAFWYARYPASKGADGNLVHDIGAKPWVNINFADAGAVAEAAGFQLARETQELVVRQLICRQPENWTGGKVGHGTVYQGLHRGTVSSAQAAYYAAPEDERNWHMLPGGEKVYGVAGNVWTWTHDDVQGDERGLIRGRIAAESISLTTAPYPSNQNGMGYRPSGDVDWSSYALIRGGYWCSDVIAGVFGLRGGWPGSGLSSVSFRCTKPTSGV